MFRVRLTGGDAASLERYENGEFLPARVFNVARPAADRDGASAAKKRNADHLERAIRHALSYLDGSVSVGERDLLSPTSAMTPQSALVPGRHSNARDLVPLLA